jgi:hypothetical protein
MSRFEEVSSLENARDAGARLRTCALCPNPADYSGYWGYFEMFNILPERSIFYVLHALCPRCAELPELERKERVEDAYAAEKKLLRVKVAAKS